MRQVHFLFLFTSVMLFGCGIGQINTGPELDIFETSAPSNTNTADGIPRIFITSLSPNNEFNIHWETKGDTSRDHTFDFFIRDESSVDDEDNGFLFRRRCGTGASVLSNCISVGDAECKFFGSTLSVRCATEQTSKVALNIKDLSRAFMIGRICYLDELLDPSCTSLTLAVEFHP